MNSTWLISFSATTNKAGGSNELAYQMQFLVGSVPDYFSKWPNTLQVQIYMIERLVQICIKQVMLSLMLNNPKYRQKQHWAWVFSLKSLPGRIQEAIRDHTQIYNLILDEEPNIRIHTWPVFVF